MTFCENRTKEVFIANRRQGIRKRVITMALWFLALCLGRWQKYLPNGERGGS